MLVLFDQLTNILLRSFGWTFMSSLRKTGFLKNGCCINESTLQRVFCLDLFHISDVWWSVFFWLRFFKLCGPKQLEVFRQSYLFPFCVFWKHVLSDQLNKNVLILLCVFFPPNCLKCSILAFLFLLSFCSSLSRWWSRFLHELVVGCSNRFNFECARCSLPVLSGQLSIVGLIPNWH